MNENQKKVTEQYRSNWDNIFVKKKEPVKAYQRQYDKEFKTLADKAFSGIINNERGE